MKRPARKTPIAAAISDAITDVVAVPEQLQVPINAEATNVVRLMLRDHVEKLEPGVKAIVAPNIQAIINNVVVLAAPDQAAPK